jgi:hypothetical protein
MTDEYDHHFCAKLEAITQCSVFLEIFSIDYLSDVFFKYIHFDKKY